MFNNGSIHSAIMVCSADLLECRYRVPTDCDHLSNDIGLFESITVGGLAPTVGTTISVDLTPRNLNIQQRKTPGTEGRMGASVKTYPSTTNDKTRRYQLG